MKKIILLIFYLSNFIGFSQGISHYNQYPTLTEDYYLDDLSNDISFAYSMRRLYSDYTGPLVKLRRSSDNNTQDFYATDTDLIDISAITTWSGTSLIYIETWYDQSSAVRNAIQTTNNRQPQFFVDPVLPYFKGDGSNDYLEVQNGNIQNVTAAGKNGSILFVAQATRKAQTSFGVLNGLNRWSVHLNWSSTSGFAYFDPGSCCNGNRRFNNSDGKDVWKQYTFITGTSSILMRRNAEQKLSGPISTTKCTLTSNFFISAASNSANNPASYSTTGFSEMILYKTDVAAVTYETIEQTQIAFWEL